MDHGQPASLAASPGRSVCPHCPVFTCPAVLSRKSAPQRPPLMSLTLRHSGTQRFLQEGFPSPPRPQAELLVGASCSQVSPGPCHTPLSFLFTRHLSTYVMSQFRAGPGSYSPVCSRHSALSLALDTCGAARTPVSVHSFTVQWDSPPRGGAGWAGKSWAQHAFYFLSCYVQNA